MKMFKSAALASVAIVVVIVFCTNRSMATPCVTFNEQGGATFATAVDVSNNTCQIGALGGSDNAKIEYNNASVQEYDYYTFYWGGGILEITGEYGSTDGNVRDVYIQLLNMNQTILYGPELLTEGSDFPSAGLMPVDTDLSAGTYIVEMYVTNGTDDPNIEMEFSSAVAAVPEPPSLAIFGAALAGLGFLHRRKRKVA